MIKNIITFITITTILTSYALAAVFTSPTTKVYSGTQGVSIPVTLNTQSDVISAFDATMQYDSTKVVFKSMTLDSSVYDKNVSFNQTGPGEVKFIIYGINKNELSNGKTFDVIFDTIEGNSGQVSVQFVNVSGSTPDAQSVQITIDPILFDLVIKGDINKDGVVNSQDVVLLAKHLIGLESLLVADADLNGDGSITVSDLQALVNIILG
jgi:hypothetical protein